ncbi:MAG: TIGR03557 family F420-dependent LLM class oxidoreductase [Actinomycetota bacterium]|nr:TIGR03557 family F420-dependent LLM class oxidoreductase [Actinomycetota bacterium]
MARLGYHLSSEEHPPADLVGYARTAEETGFSFALISDHFHPWIRRQGHAPFVWSVLGAIAQATTTLRVGTGVTAPIMRMHPGIVAHAAATVSTMMPGRFFLGVGSGELLNEHIFGDEWPRAGIRREMLSEAIDVIRDLWKGDQTSHRGRYYKVEGAQIFDLEEPPPIVMAAGGKRAVKLAAEKADGLISVVADKSALEAYDEAGGSGKPRYIKLAVCYDENEQEARRQVHKQWPIDAMPGRLLTEQRLPQDFEAIAELVTEQQAADSVLCGPDPGRHIEKIKRYFEAGYDHVYVHQIGPNQKGFFSFYEQQVIPHLEELESD